MTWEQTTPLVALMQIATVGTGAIGSIFAFQLADPPRGDLNGRPGPFVSGPLADLELGPVARNIAGARAAARRLVLAA